MNPGVINPCTSWLFLQTLVQANDSGGEEHEETQWDSKNWHSQRLGSVSSFASEAGRLGPGEVQRIL